MTSPTELCTLEDGSLKVVIPLDNLRFAAENHPSFDQTQDEQIPTLRITDLEAFARDVRRALNCEAEDGSTPITRVLDSAIVDAVEYGTEAIEPLD